MNQNLDYEGGVLIPVEDSPRHSHIQNRVEYYPYSEKIAYCIFTILYCAILIYILQNYCINPDCAKPTEFANILIFLLYGAMIIRILFLFSIMCSYFSAKLLVPTIIFEQKLSEAEFLITTTFLFYVIFFYVLAEKCRTQQLGFAVMFCITYVILRLICLPQGIINYFDGEYI